MRALIHLLSLELFGQSLPLPGFPTLRAVRALGMTDKETYAGRLAEKFNYTNTYFDREPRVDFNETHPELAGLYDFIISADVLEHVAAPPERALTEVCRLLKPNGFLVGTVPCHQGAQTREHFPDLHEYRVILLGDSPVLVNRRRDGSIEVSEHLAFHGGTGSTLEMRQFSVADLQGSLRASGFCEVAFLSRDVPEFGILFDADVSVPFTARKGEYQWDRATRSQIVDQWRAAQNRLQWERDCSAVCEAQILMASRSRWLRLGRKLGIGPKFGPFPRKLGTGEGPP
ncbi:MAG TPA: methyltransferase domain-containing protein [Bryobacteraceae bacterium]|nr:methyltransferase domain-containing protein [Bryobacteraceae bacterium]